MKNITVEQVDFLIKMLTFFTPRQRKSFLQTMNKKQMEIFEVACFNLATNHKGLTKSELLLKV